MVLGQSSVPIAALTIWITDSFTSTAYLRMSRFQTSRLRESMESTDTVILRGLPTRSPGVSPRIRRTANNVLVAPSSRLVQVSRQADVEIAPRPALPAAL